MMGGSARVVTMPSGVPVVTVRVECALVYIVRWVGAEARIPAIASS